MTTYSTLASLSLLSLCANKRTFFFQQQSDFSSYPTGRSIISSPLGISLKLFGPHEAIIKFNLMFLQTVYPIQTQCVDCRSYLRNMILDCSGNLTFEYWGQVEGGENIFYLKGIDLKARDHCVWVTPTIHPAEKVEN